MAATASIKIVKTFTYRGAVREWSNRYHFDLAAPPSGARWTILADAIVAAEKAALNNLVTIVGAVGYAAGSDVPVFTKTYSVVGLTATSGIPQAPGDSAILVRYSTPDRSTKNHPIYCFNYYHGVNLNVLTSGDTVSNTQVTNMQTYAAAWVTGFSDGTVTYVRASPNGHICTGSLVSAVTHHRDFPGG